MHFLLLCFIIINAVASQKMCQSHLYKTCQECLSAHPNCVWITDLDLNKNQTRCNIREETSGKRIIIGGHSAVNINTSEDYRLPSSSQSAIQVKPQHIKLSLRHGESQTFNITYKALKDYPLDIYYLVDQTYSMLKHVKELGELGEQLANELASLTANFQIGFGYFSDKVKMPYFSMVPKTLKDPCNDESLHCVPGSNFVHELKFTNDTDKFIDKIKAFKFTANADDPEGALDAIMQILMCESFGWRTHSRKMIVLATNGLLHMAGDGLLGGATRRGLQCMMKQLDNGRFVYEGLEHDYPSIEEVYRQLLKNKTSVLFAIQHKEGSDKYYKEINKLLHEVSFLAMMQEDTPNNITDILAAGFRDAVQKVQFKVEDHSDYLEFQASSYCGSKEENITWSCWNVQLETEYVFQIKVTLNGRPHRKREFIKIEETHLHEAVDIEVEYLENCECETPKDTEPDIHGVFECGIYICHPTWVGERCDKMCDPYKASNIEHCNRTCCGNGDFDFDTCACKCDDSHVGEHCDIECPVVNGKICAGNGKCEINGCICSQDFEGDDCSCYRRNDTCINKNTNTLCSNHGTCVCGKCQCDKSENIKYKGTHCQLCSGCQSCLYNDILQKHLNGMLGKTDSQNYVIWSSPASSKFDCKVYHSPNSTHECTANYKSTMNNTIYIEYYLECARSDFIGKAGFYVTSGLPYLIGVLAALFCGLVSYKVMIVIKDKREWSNFEKQTAGTSLNESPLYISPVTHYENPLKKNT